MVQAFAQAPVPAVHASTVAAAVVHVPVMLESHLPTQVWSEQSHAVKHAMYAPHEASSEEIAEGQLDATHESHDDISALCALLGFLQLGRLLLLELEQPVAAVAATPRPRRETTRMERMGLVM
jgi:hypothetical protein